MKQKDTKLLYQIAELYYEEGYTQEKIAQLVNFSRQKVQRLLKEGIEEGIVQINLFNPSASFEKLEKKLEQKYDLLKVLVVPAGIQSDEIISKNIGKAAAGYLESILHDNDIVGIGWGSSVYETINHFNPHRKIQITAIPLIGGMGYIPADFQVNELIRKFAEKSGGSYIPLYAPALLDNEKIVKQLFTDNNVKKINEFWNIINIAVVGIGKAILKGSIVPDIYYNDLPLHSIMENEKVAGDILLHFFHNDGSLFSSVFDKRIIGMSIDQLKKVKRVIGVAGSLWKKDIILATLKGKYINILVTDDITATALSKG